MAEILNKKYYSGSQASLYIGDVWVDEIVNYSFTIQHNRTPVYGYGSQHWDFMPKGTILVMGEFAINFKEPNYLWIILERYKKFQMTGGRTPSENEKLEKLQGQLKVLPETFTQDTRRSLNTFFAAKTQDLQSVSDAMKLNFNEEGLAVNQRKKREILNHASFNMVLGYGKPGPDSVGERINDIQIMQKTKVLDSDGRPITETYSFIARDMR